MASASTSFARRSVLQARPSRRQAPRRTLTRPSAFSVTLDTPEGQKKIECDESTYILDAADDAGLDLPYSCRSGTCGTCAAKLTEGDMSLIDQVQIPYIAPAIDRTDQANFRAVWLVQDSNSFLEDFMVENKVLLTCTSYPKGDVTLKTHQEDNVYD